MYLEENQPMEAIDNIRQAKTLIERNPRLPPTLQTFSLSTLKRISTKMF